MNATVTSKSKLRALGSGLHITPGTQIVKIMSTKNVDGNSAQLLREIAQRKEGFRILRDFPFDWEFDGEVLVNKGKIVFNDRQFPLTVKIGSADCDGLVLVDVGGEQCSMQTKNGAMVLEVGSNLSASRLESLASQMVGTWVVHGQNWRDRREKLFLKPWGQTKRGLPEKFCFEVIDGALCQPKLTLADLIRLGCRRSTHVGEWHLRHSTIIPAVADMGMTIHEFKKDGGQDICWFNGLQIGTHPDVWGPYCFWNEKVWRSGELGVWQDLALRCACPFNFHVHATKTLFPKIQLDSDYLLQSVGQDMLRAIIEVMVAKQPSRFYRIIDEYGETYRQTGIADDVVAYGNYGNFPRHRITENVMQTFLELSLICSDPSRLMIRKPRIVIDSHAYIVIEAMARRQKEVYELSGRYMHMYLTDGTDANMHRIRNEELFILLRDFFGLQSLKFYIYPPLAWNSGLNSQYDANLKYCNKEEWLAKEV